MCLKLVETEREKKKAHLESSERERERVSEKSNCTPAQSPLVFNDFTGEEVDFVFLVQNTVEPPA